MDGFEGFLLFLVIALFCALIAILVPVLVYVYRGNPCSPALSLNRNEQMICISDDPEGEWTAKWDKKVKDYGKLYRIDNETRLLLNTTTRSYQWNNVKFSCYYDSYYDYFTFSSVISVNGTIKVKCSGNKCYKVKGYLLTKRQFEDSKEEETDYEGYTKYYFIVKNFTEKWEGFEDKESKTLTFNERGAEYWHIIFVQSSATLEANIRLDYSVFDLSSLKPETCEDNKCVFDDMKNGDTLILDYNSSTTSGDNEKTGSEPISFSTEMHDGKYSKGMVIGFAVAFSVLCILFVVAAFVFLSI